MLCHLDKPTLDILLFVAVVVLLHQIVSCIIEFQSLKSSYKHSSLSRLHHLSQPALSLGYNPSNGLSPHGPIHIQPGLILNQLLQSPLRHVIVLLRTEIIQSARHFRPEGLNVELGATECELAEPSAGKLRPRIEVRICLLEAGVGECLLELGREAWVNVPADEKLKDF